MPDTPTALPDRAKVRALIRERGFSITGAARRIGRPRATLYAITGRTVPKPTGVEILADLAALLSTPKHRVRVSDISDWAGDDESEPEPEALASLDANKAPRCNRGARSGIGPASESNRKG